MLGSCLRLVEILLKRFRSGLITVQFLNSPFLPFTSLFFAVGSVLQVAVANYGQTFTPFCGQTPPLPLLMIYSGAFAPFITHFLQTMVGHSHLLAEKTPLLPLLMICSREFSAFITHFLKTMVGHSLFLAAKHLRSRF